MNYKAYPPEWKTMIVPRLLARDSYKCCHCGIGHGVQAYRRGKSPFFEADQHTALWATEQGYKVVKVWLQVAHIDHVKANVDFSNLITLCPICHARHDARHRAVLRLALNSLAVDSKSKIQDYKRDRYQKYGPEIKEIILNDYDLRISTDTVKKIIALFR